MGTISLSYIYFTYLRESEKDTLAAFARADGCYRIYKFAMEPGGPKNHALPIRSERDEQGLFGSQRVHDPVCIWPVNERSERLNSRLKLVELEGDTLDQARRSIPAGYKIIVEEIISQGGQRTATGNGKTELEAHEKALFLKPKDVLVLSENLIVDYEQFNIQVKAGSGTEARELAYAAAQDKGLKLSDFQVLLADSGADQPRPEKITLNVTAADEAAALAQGQAAAHEKAIDDPRFSVRLVTPGKKGFLGIGAKQNQYAVDMVRPVLYEIEFVRPACFEIVYTQKARIKTVIGA